MDPITGQAVDNAHNAVHAASTKAANLPQVRHKAEYKPPEHKVGACYRYASSCCMPTTTKHWVPEMWPHDPEPADSLHGRNTAGAPVT